MKRGRSERTVKKRWTTWWNIHVVGCVDRHRFRDPFLSQLPFSASFIFNNNKLLLQRTSLLSASVEVFHFLFLFVISLPSVVFFESLDDKSRQRWNNIKLAEITSNSPRAFNVVPHCSLVVFEAKNYSWLCITSTFLCLNRRKIKLKTSMNTNRYNNINIHYGVFVHVKM